MLTLRTRLASIKGNESGFTTAELLGNAALGVIALVAIWALLGKLGNGVVESIGEKLGVNL